MAPHKLFVAVLLALVVRSHPASAQVVAYDPFNHSAPFQLNGTASSGGGAVWPSANTWQPLSGNGGVTNPGDLSYGPLQTTGNHADFHRFDVVTASIRSMAANQGGPGRDLWVSMLMNPTGNDQGMGLYNGSTEQVFVGTPGGVTTFGMRLDAGVTGSGAIVLSAAPPVTATGPTHFVGLHLSLTTTGASSVTLYVDPDFSSLGTAAPTGGSTVSYTTANPFPFESLALGNAGPVGTTVGFDEFRMGPAWADVSPVAVPEPSTLVLAGCGLAAAFGLRRRRTK
jgi:hypothetical protein